MALDDVRAVASELQAYSDSFKATKEAKELDRLNDEVKVIANLFFQKGGTRSQIDDKFKPGFFPRIVGKKDRVYTKLVKYEEKRTVYQKEISQDKNLAAISQQYSNLSQSELLSKLKHKKADLSKQYETVQKMEFTLIAGKHKGKKVSFEDFKGEMKTKAKKAVKTLSDRQDKSLKVYQSKAGQMRYALLKDKINPEFVVRFDKWFAHYANARGVKLNRSI